MNKYSSIFSLLISVFPRLDFERLVRQTGAARDDHALIAEEIFHLDSPEYFLGFPLELEREDFSIGINHQVDEALKVGLGPPTELIAGF